MLSHVLTSFLSILYEVSAPSLPFGRSNHGHSPLPTAVSDSPWLRREYHDSVSPVAVSRHQRTKLPSHFKAHSPLLSTCTSLKQLMRSFWLSAPIPVALNSFRPSWSPSSLVARGLRVYHTPRSTRRLPLSRSSMEPTFSVP